MKKIVTIAAVAALATLAACERKNPEAAATETIELPADETATDNADDAADAVDAGAIVAPVGQQHQL